MISRSASVTRNTKETQIQLTLEIDSPGRIEINTPLPFFSHMLTAFATHGRFGLQIEAQGDIEVDPHHLIEDVGITLGQAIMQALDGYKGILRAGCFAFPMDGTLAVTALDLCGRPNLVWNASFGAHSIGNLDPNLFKEFYKGLADGMRGTLHIHIPCQDNDHHVVEAIFKSFGRALKEATVRTESGEALSTKGVIET